MAVRLNSPLSTTPNADEQAMLAQLQENILRSHGRDRTAIVFLRVKAGQAAKARKFLKAFAASKLKSAADQLSAVEAIRRGGAARRSANVQRASILIVLSAKGYAALGINLASSPGDAAFTAGMAARATLNDPDRSLWQTGYRKDAHIMILIGGSADAADSETSALVETELAALLLKLPAAGLALIQKEKGRGFNNAAGDGMEHFGYVDGRSQPRLTDDDIAAEKAKEPEPFAWNPGFPLKQVLVKDPAVSDANAFGSYFVFRKLEQNVKAFVAAEKALQTQLEALATNAGKTFAPDLAGAMIVGRFRDGTPATLQSSSGLNAPVRNNFGFAADESGLKCPFHAHIRKSNPRGDSVPLGATLEGERSHIMARRGITYGKRKIVGGAFKNAPAKNVGLLFMAYQSEIGNQFEFTQSSWVNNVGFSRGNTGIDPVIGQGNGGPQTHRAGWNASAAPSVQSDFSGFVTLKGGEYFFAPSLLFFASL